MATTETAGTGPSASPAARRLRRMATGLAIGTRALLGDPRFYAALIVLTFGIQLNFHAQVYLHEKFQSDANMPKLSDLILDNLSYLDIGFAYDLLVLMTLGLFALYVVDEQQYHRVPYIIVLCGAFQILRAVFIVLTPFGHPELFDGTEGLFNGFSKFEMGVYPSGHTGVTFLYVLLAHRKLYRTVLLVCVLMIIASLFLSRGHYSIDVISGLIFAYAIKSFGDKHLKEHLTVKALPARLRAARIRALRRGNGTP